MAIVAKSEPTLSELKRLIGNDPIFLLREEENGGSRYLSSERLDDYLTFLHKVGWLAQPQGRYKLTSEGESVRDSSAFNKALLTVIENKVLPEGVSFDFLDDIVKGLLTDLIPTTPSRIKERAAYAGKVIELDAATRLSFQVLPSTGRFLKGAADAIFPAEPNGGQAYSGR